MFLRALLHLTLKIAKNIFYGSLLFSLLKIVNNDLI